MPVVAAQLSQYMLHSDPNCLSTRLIKIPTVSVCAKFGSSSLIMPVFFAKLSQYTLYLDPNWLPQPHYRCSFYPTLSVFFRQRRQKR